jgi:hypothetical protein
MFAYNAHAGIMMSRSKKFEFLCDNSELIKKSESTKEIVVAQIESKMDASPDSSALVKKLELSEFDRLGPVGFGKKYGMAHYLVVRLGMQNNLSQLVIDKIVEQAKHIPEAKKSIKYFSNYDHFESYHTLMHLVNPAINKNNSCFSGGMPYFTGSQNGPYGHQSDFRQDFYINFQNEARFPYKEWLALGCFQDVELCLSRLSDNNKEYLKELNDSILGSPKFGSSCCDSLQEQAIDMGSGVVETVDTQTLSLKRTFKHENGLPFMRIIYNPDGTELATQDVRGTITFWDLKTGSRTHTIPASPLLPCLYFNEGKEFVHSLDGLHWRVIRWTLFKKFERNDYQIEKCNLIETLLDKKIEAVSDKTESKDLDEEIEFFVIIDENDDYYEH